MRRNLIIMSLALLLIGLSTYYHWPVNIVKSYSAVLVNNGQEIDTTIQVDLKLKRRLLTENHLSGVVEISGVEYLVDNFNNNHGTSLPEINLIEKITNEFYRVPYYLTDIRYDRDANRVITTASVDITRNFETMTGFLFKHNNEINMTFTAYEDKQEI